ncbi:hypothetical protein ACH4MT_09255 [Streptomyces anulatus]
MVERLIAAGHDVVVSSPAPAALPAAWHTVSGPRGGGRRRRRHLHRAARLRGGPHGRRTGARTRNRRRGSRLAALEADGRLTHGRRVLLLASSARSWSLTALERVDPAPA